MNLNLDLCPFCGSDDIKIVEYTLPKEEVTEYPFIKIYVQCQKCACRTDYWTVEKISSQEVEERKETAVKYWNNRCVKNPDKQAEKLELIERINRRLVGIENGGSFTSYQWVEMLNTFKTVLLRD